MFFKYKTALIKNISFIESLKSVCIKKVVHSHSIMLASLFVLAYLFTGCKKLVDVKPPVTSLTGSAVYSTDATAASVLTGIYTKLSSSGPLTSGAITSISLKSGLSADELVLVNGSANPNGNLARFYTNTLSTTTNETFWENLYNYLQPVNSALEGINASSTLTPSVKNQLIGEAKFLRAFLHFYLVNFYGDMPLVTSSDYRINAVMPRTPKDQVVQQIILDLIDAQSLLSDGYVASDAKTTTLERVRPNKWAATALLARVYLYSGNWSNAESEATKIINNTSKYAVLSNLTDVFLKNSTEAIWQLQPVNTGWNTEDSRTFILNVAPIGLNNSHPVYISSMLLNSFETADKRRKSWTDSLVISGQAYYYPFKYKATTTTGSLSEYLMVLRLSEQYLIRAEARAKQNNLSGAIADIDMIRQRAGLPLIATTNPGISQSALFTAILHERQVELFTEWGHRWLDLKRTGNINDVMTIVTPLKGGTWNSNWQWYPLPLYEIQQNPNLKQNTGY